jgi:hypothetical protein
MSVDITADMRVTTVGTLVPRAREKETLTSMALVAVVRVPCLRMGGLAARVSLLSSNGYTMKN